MTISRHSYLVITLISISTLLLSRSAGLAIERFIALLIEDAVVIVLLKGKPLAVFHLIALCNAILKCGDGKRVDKVSLALECPMTFSGRTCDTLRRLESL